MNSRPKPKGMDAPNVEGFRFCWKIAEYSKCNRRKGVGIESRIFNYVRGTVNIDWQLIWYPAGVGKRSTEGNGLDPENGEEDDHPFVYLKMARCNFPSVTATFRIWCEFIRNLNPPFKLKGKIHEQEAQFSFVSDTMLGWRQNDTATFTAYSMEFGDKLEWHCEIDSVKVKGELEVDSSCVCPQYWSFYEQQQLTDMVIQVGNKEFAVHKLVLASRSPVFKAMFVHRTTESANNRLQITDFEADTVEKLIKFMYTGRCENPGDSAAELLACAEKYDLQVLKTICEAALAVVLDAQNAVTILQLADLNRAHRLKEMAMKFIKNNIQLVMASPGWGSLISGAPLVNDVIKFLVPEQFGSNSKIK